MITSSVIIVAGGSGVRMGGGIKKEFALIGSRPALYHAVKPFLDTGFFTSIVIVINNSLQEQAARLLAQHLSPEETEKVFYVSGGSSRRESVLNGLLALKVPDNEDPEVVLIHDGARPWITQEIIRAVYNKTLEKGAAIPVIPAVNALKEIDSEGRVIKSIKRDGVAGAQTPQGFLFGNILSAHLSAAETGRDFADDAEVYFEFSGDVYTVPGDVKNRKITFREDLKEVQ